MPQTAPRKRKAETKKKSVKATKKAELVPEFAPPQTPIPTPTLPPLPAPTPLPQPPKVEEKPPGTTLVDMAPIRADEFDPHFKVEIGKMHGGEKLKLCFQCGTCTSDCPIARFSNSYRPRHIIRMAQLGLRDRVLSSETLWLCASCFTCTDRCPQDVEVASVIRILRNAAVKRGMMPPIFKELGTSILDTCIAYQIPELRLKKRGEAGLPPLPKGNPEAMAKLAKATGFWSTVRGKAT